jgi:hypothetical protein
VPLAELIDNVPTSDPAVVGENVTDTVHEAPVARLVPHVLVCAKFPVTEMLVMGVAGLSELLVIVTVWLVLVVFTF